METSRYVEQKHVQLVFHSRIVGELSGSCVSTRRLHVTVLTRVCGRKPRVLPPKVNLLLSTLSSKKRGDLKVSLLGLFRWSSG